MNWRRFARSITPPLLASAVRRVRARFEDVEWEYLPNGWPDDASRTNGWRDPTIVATAVARWPEFVRRTADTGPLGIAYEHPVMTSNDRSAHESTYGFAYALARAATKKPAVSVLDWGGGLGHYALLARALFPALDLTYDVYDLSAMCEAGSGLLPDVRFISESNQLRDMYDLSVAIGSLHYSRDWQSALRTMAAHTRDYLYLARLPVVNTGQSFVAVQRAHRYGYEAELVCWILNRDELMDTARALGLTLVRDLLMDESPDIAGAPERARAAGFLFRR